VAFATSRRVMIAPRYEKCRITGGAVAFMLALASAQPAAAQQVRAGLLTCDVSAGIGLIVTSQKALYCTFAPDQPGIMREDYDGTITKYGLDLGVVAGGVMVWAVFTETVAGPGFLAGDYVGASGEASLGAGIGAKFWSVARTHGDAAARLSKRTDWDQHRARCGVSSLGSASALTDISNALSRPSTEKERKELTEPRPQMDPAGGRA
jgi:hypothetical protein